MRDYVVHQGRLEEVLRVLFRGETILQNVRKEADIRNPQTGGTLELDIWLPRLGLCFEFQDPHHYTTTWYSQYPLHTVQNKDNAKQNIVSRKDITLVLVPPWWDGSQESLQAAIHFQRPDVVIFSESPIPLNPSVDFTIGTVPEVGELMLASFPPQSLKISAIDPWWMGEKYDGVRFCWNSERSSLYTRNGRTIFLPDQLYDSFPDTLLEGEIWFGRNSFLDAQKVVISASQNVEWHFFRCVGFDVPSPELRAAQYETRYEHILLSIEKNNPLIIPAPRILCNSSSHLSSALEQIINNEGEGIILTLPSSFYEHGRSPSLLKLKAYRGDKEALVVDVEDADIMLQLPDGRTTEIRDPDIAAELKSGDVVTISYENFNSVSANIERTRLDLSWEEIVREYHRHPVLNDSSIRAVGSQGTPEKIETRTSSGKFWVDPLNKRKFLENFATERGLDPLAADNWYKLEDELLRAKEEDLPILRYAGDFRKALVHLFPEIGLTETSFRSYWAQPANRKEFFDSFARKTGFDPSVPENWYAVSPKQLREHKGYDTVCSYHHKSFVKALLDLYPDLGLDKSKFYMNPDSHWKHEEYQKRFLLDFAKSQKFDPLVAENWYSVDPSKIKDHVVGNAILSFYSNSFRAAILHLFPDLELKKSKLPLSLDIEARRGVFKDFAAKAGFDPLIPSNWYSVKQRDLFSFPGVKGIVEHYGGIGKTLAQLFPNFVELELQNKPNNYFLDTGTRRKLFEDFAVMNGFNPLVPENWYSCPREQILQDKRATGILKYYRNSFPAALMNLFPDVAWDESKFPRLHRQKL